MESSFDIIIIGAGHNGLVCAAYLRLGKRIINNHESLLRIDWALEAPLRFEQYQHRDEYLIGSILIADSVEQIETAHHEASRGCIPDQDPSMYVVVPTMLDPSMAPEGKHTLWIEFFAPYQIAGAEGTGLSGTGWTDTLKNQVADRVLAKLADYSPNLRHSVIARRVESPAELGPRLGFREPTRHRQSVRRYAAICRGGSCEFVIPHPPFADTN